MRIAYVSLHWPRTHNSGVGKKIQAQIGTWNAMGHKARLFMHSTNHEPLSDLIEADYFFYQTAGKLRTEFNRIVAARQMIAAIRAFRPDIIYLRYGIYAYPVHLLMHIAPVVEEINTNDLTQHEELGALYSTYNRLTRGVLLKRISGFVAVSHELATDTAFSAFRKPARVIANGIDLNTFQPLAAPNNKTPHLLFIGSPGNTWHGIDKLIQMASALPEFQVDIVGLNSIPGEDSLPNNLILHGYLNSQQYRDIMAKADVAISSLALHRIGLQEASPLKSRECLAFGLPLILAYKDTDLDGLECEFLLQIPNQEDNIQLNLESIRDFIYRMRGQRVVREKIASIDQHYKEMNRLAFFEEIISNEKPVSRTGAYL